jgi:hypothetical protein
MGLRDTIIYTTFLVLLDGLASIALNLLQGYPGGVLMVSIVIRFMTLIIAFPASTLLVTLCQVKGNIKVAALASLVTYLLIPIVIFFLKENHRSLGETFADIYTRKSLFVLIVLPFIIASIGNLILFRRLFNW